MGKKDIPWINALRALCIIFVFLAHCQSNYGTKLVLVHSIYLPFYVNAFFFVSGYLLFWKQLSSPKILESGSQYLIGGGKTLFLNIIFRIVIPSIFFSIIEYIPASLIRGRSIDYSSFFFKTIGGQTYWFTSALVVAELILLILFMTRRKSIWFYAVIAIPLGALGIYMAHNDITIFSRNWWEYRQGIIAVMFLAFGGLYWRYERIIRKVLKWWVELILCGAYFSIILLCKHAAPTISTLSIEPLGVVTSLIACVLLVELCRILPESRVLTFIGQNSIGFYFMSGALPIICSFIVHKFLSESTVWGLLIVFAVCLMVAYLVMKVLTRWAPWLFDLRVLCARNR
ncbi:MAG: acyltransferase [Bacteroidales bacterium]|nr:acyltransferase [Bacteroidales bacterium]